MKSTLLAALTAALILTACDGGGSTPPAKDTTAPTVSLSASAPDDKGAVTVSATATDNIRVTKVEFYQGTTLLTTDTTAPFTYPTSLDKNRNNFTAKAYDAAGNVGTSAAFNISTVFQGVWEWGLVDAAGTLLDSGVVIFATEFNSDFGRVALGPYANKGQTKSGPAAMGPVTAAGVLEVGFALTSDFSVGYFDATDDDGKFGDYQGHPTFVGSGSTYDSAGKPVSSVGVVLVQDSTEIPAATAAVRPNQSTPSRVAELMRSPIPARLAPLKVSPDAAQAAIQTLLNR